MLAETFIPYLDKKRISFPILLRRSCSFLSILFLLGQYKVWKYLIANDIYFVGNPSGSFLYIFTGLHALHLLSGIFAIFFIWSLVLLNKKLNKKIEKKIIFKMELCSIYWHFLDFLWIYLFFFLIINH